MQEKKPGLCVSWGGGKRHWMSGQEFASVLKATVAPPNKILPSRLTLPSRKVDPGKTTENLKGCGVCYRRDGLKGILTAEAKVKLK